MQQVPRPGEITLAQTGCGVVCRRYLPDRLGYVRLAPANETHPAIFVRERELRVVGVVIGRVESIGAGK